MIATETIEYGSTRRQDGRKYPFTGTLLRGIADDGGLFVPERLPTIYQEELAALCGMDYAGRASRIINLSQSDLDPEVVAIGTQRAYNGDNFDHPYIAPVVFFKKDQYLAELWHGPTASFKDMALQLMSYLHSCAINQDNVQRLGEGKAPRHHLILGATSGDTGSAAMNAYSDLRDILAMVFYPDQKVSRLQELQMVTQDGQNIRAHAMHGDFDDIQRAVKGVFADKKFIQELERNDVALSSANSISWGRIPSQSVFHVNDYLELVSQGYISLGQTVDVAVPTGNFGNILSAYYAREMGLPLGRLICASNENNVLTDFIQTGVYDVRDRQLVQTPSPSMDILVASNVERLLYGLTGDPKRVREWMQQLDQAGRFEVDEEIKMKLREIFYADWVSNQDCLDNIRAGVEKTGILMDPHTSVAQAVAERYLNKTSTPRSTIICATAHWAKFAPDVFSALTGETVAGMNEFRAIEEVQKLVPGATVPRSITELEGRKVRKTAIFNADVNGVESAIVKFLNSV